VTDTTETDPDSPGQIEAAAKPPTVVWAVRLMYSAAIILFVSEVISDALILQGPGNGAPPVPPSIWVTDSALFSVAYIGAWLWMAWKNSRGRNWARILGTVFFVVFCGDFAHKVIQNLNLTVGSSGLGAYPSFVLGLIAIAAVILIWHPRSAPFYRRRPSKTVPVTEAAPSEPGT